MQKIVDECFSKSEGEKRIFWASFGPLSAIDMDNKKVQEMYYDS
jgi:hypothetical protein